MKLSRATQWIVLCGLILIGVVLALRWVVHKHDMERRLLMALPDSLAPGSDLWRYAVPRGREAYVSHCESCHGSRLKGDRQNGVPDLTDADWLYGSGQATQIEHTILYGIRSGMPRTWDLAAMPAYATPVPYARYRVEPLSPREVDDLVSYVLSFRGKSQDTAAVARGSALFMGLKGQCYDCHSGDARGDAAIGAPDLTDSIWLYGDGSREAITDSISKGRGGRCPGWRHRLPPAQIREIALFIKSMRTASAVSDHAEPG